MCTGHNNHKVFKLLITQQKITFNLMGIDPIYLTLCSVLSSFLEDKIIYNENKMKGSRTKWSFKEGISGAYSANPTKGYHRNLFFLGLLYVFIFNILVLFSRKQGNSI